MTLRTKVGAKMNPKIRNSLIDILSDPEHEGKSQIKIAKLLKVTPKTVQNYLTHETWKEIHERRLEVISISLNLVDRAVFAKAIKGDITAAKLLYNRWDELKSYNALQSSNNQENDTLEAEEIERLKKDIQELEYEGNNDT